MGFLKDDSQKGDRFRPRGHQPFSAYWSLLLSALVLPDAASLGLAWSFLDLVSLFLFLSPQNFIQNCFDLHLIKHGIS